MLRRSLLLLLILSATCIILWSSQEVIVFSDSNALDKKVGPEVLLSEENSKANINQPKLQRLTTDASSYKQKIDSDLKKKIELPLPNLEPQEEKTGSPFSKKESLETVTILSQLQRANVTLSEPDIEEYIEKVKLEKSREGILSLADEYSQGDILIRTHLIRWAYKNSYLHREKSIITHQPPEISHSQRSEIPSEEK